MVVLHYSDSPPAPGEVEIQSRTKKQRIMALVKGWGICWVLAVGAAFLPVLHFIIVPALLITGPIVGSAMYGQKESILGGKGACPACQAELKIEKGPLRWPIDELCTSCRRTIRIQPIEQN